MYFYRIEELFKKKAKKTSCAAMRLDDFIAVALEVHCGTANFT